MLFMYYSYICDSTQIQNQLNLTHTHTLTLTLCRLLVPHLREEQEMHCGPQVIKRKCLQGRLSDYFFEIAARPILFIINSLSGSLQTLIQA